MNVRLLRRIQRYILEEPRRLVMEIEGGSAQHCGYIPDYDRPPCGTVGCIAGWTYVLTTPNAVLEDGSFRSPNRIISYSEKKLGLTEGQANRLFYLKMHAYGEWNHWPAKFEKAYFAAKTPKGKARAAIRRIDHFIKTEGRE